MKRRWLFVVALLAVCLAAWMFASVWLSAAGAMLVDSGAPRKADAVLVLAGDHRGDRILTACDLVRRGFAPVVLVSGPMAWYGINEADAAIAFGTKHGCNASTMRPLYIKAFSTTDEARKIRPVLDQLGVRDILIVTSNFHTARASRIYSLEYRGDVRFTMVASPDEFFEPNRWWKTREGQKTVFYEFSKTVANWIGL